MAAIRLNYRKYPRLPGLRPVAGGHRTLDQEPELHRKQNPLQFRLRLSAQHAAMVDNPADLVQPGPKRPLYDPTRHAFEKYRKGAPTTVVYSDPDKAKLRNSQMISYAQKNPKDQPTSLPPDDHIARRRHVCLCRPFARRWKPQPPCNRRAKTAARQGHLKIQMGGMAAAINVSYRAYSERDHPGDRRPQRYPHGLDQLANRVRFRIPRLVIGRVNDSLLSRAGAPGVSDYVIAPVTHRRGAFGLRPVLGAGGQGGWPDTPSSSQRRRRRSPSPTTSPGRSRATSHWTPSSHL